MSWKHTLSDYIDSVFPIAPPSEFAWLLSNVQLDTWVRQLWPAYIAPPEIAAQLSVNTELVTVLKMFILWKIAAPPTPP